MDYPGKTSHTAHLETIRVLLNAIVSEEATNFFTADIKDFYLGTPLEHPEYMRINLKQIPLDVKEKYGLPQAGLLSQDHLVRHLATHGYTQCANPPCLFSKPTVRKLFAW